MVFVHLPYEVGPIRPPSEAKSLMIRVTRNCKWNRCAFCPVYKHSEFERRPLVDILTDIDRAASFYYLEGNVFKSSFLQDADALDMPTADLIAILKKIRERFPSVDCITTYGRAGSIYKKSLAELKELRDAGLTRIHRGLESGYDALLRYMHKGANAKMQILSGQRVKEAGITLSDYVMPGLGGNLQLDCQPAWKRHAEETARVLNEVNPDYIRLRTLVVINGTPLAERQDAGDFSRLSDQEIIREIRFFISLLSGITSVLESDHIMNVLTELKGKLPEDKERMIATIDRYLSMSAEEQLVFRIGVLLNSLGYGMFGLAYFFTLDDFEVVRARADTIIADTGGKSTAEDLLRHLMQGCV